MPRSTSKLRRHYEQTYRSLSRVELQRGMRPLDSLELSELFDYDTDLWLGFYTEEGVRLALERYGVVADVQRRGFEELRIELSMDDPEEQMLRVWSDKPTCAEPLLELVVSRGVLHFEEEFSDALVRPFAQVLNIQWLLMQNPMTQFGPEKLPLPGQVHPGLGLGEQVMELLKNSCRRLNLDGIVTVPAHYHNAMMYGQTFSYVDPEAEGAFRALGRDLFGHVDSVPDAAQLAAVSWAMHWKMVMDKNGNGEKPFEWFHEAMVYPIDDSLKAYFEASTYRQEVELARNSHQFELFKAPLKRSMETCGLAPWNHERAQEWMKNFL